MKKLLAGVLTGAAVLSSLSGVAFAADTANIVAETTEMGVFTIATDDGVFDAEEISSISLIPLENGDYEVQFELKDGAASETDKVKATVKSVDLNSLSGNIVKYDTVKDMDAKNAVGYAKMQVIEK